MSRRLAAFLAKHRPKRKWLEIIWKKVKFLWWEISWIDKAYVFGKRFHHLELGIILIFIGWILVIHDWFVEKPKVSAVSIEFEAKKIIRHEDGSIELKDARNKKDSTCLCAETGQQGWQVKIEILQAEASLREATREGRRGTGGKLMERPDFCVEKHCRPVFCDYRKDYVKRGGSATCIGVLEKPVKFVYD